jgi:hypothetical protein
MPSGLPVIDLFGALAYWRRRKPLGQVIRILRGESPLLPGESPWGFPIFRPTGGPSTGPASGGGIPILLNPSIPGRGLPGGSARRDFTGVFVGPPEPSPQSSPTVFF